MASDNVLLTTHTHMTLFLIFLMSSWGGGIILRNKPAWWRYLFLSVMSALLCYAYLYTNEM